MAAIAYEDFSGSSTPPTENPFDALLDACNQDPAKLQARYTAHRIGRNAQQEMAIMGPKFEGWKLDPVLVKLDGPQRDPNFEDPRNCLVLWARPPKALRSLIAAIQERLLRNAPKLWIMPPHCLHMTAMEVTHSKTAEEIDHLVNILLPNAESITDYPYHHRARLIKPMISYDSAALALSFLPAAGEGLSSGRARRDDDYTYHHLRRDLLAQCRDSGVKVASRYIVPSAHLTIARFNSPNVFEGDVMDGNIALDTMLREKWINEIQEINTWLEKEYWPKDGVPIRPEGEWIVGEEVGLDFHKGTLWYGGGERIRQGKPFERDS